MSLETQQLHDFEKDSRWFHSHLDELRKGYLNEFVAVEKGDVITSGKTVDSVLEKLERMKKDPRFILIEFVHEKTKMVLL